MGVRRLDETKSHSRSWLPDWAASAVFYRIDPTEMFADSSEFRLVENVDLDPWYDHLEQLGVTAVSLGSIFEGSLGRAGVSDYFSVDRRIGDIRNFRNILNDLHGRNIKLILDADFVCTGPDFFAFQDIREFGQSSQFADWYSIDWDAQDLSKYIDGQVLPRLNPNNSRVRKYMLEVARMWLADYSFDGWRLRSVGEADPSFWWEFRQVCKEANPECLLIADRIEGDYRKFVAPDLLDTAVNFHLHLSALDSESGHSFDPLRAALERASHAEVGVYRDLSLINPTGSDGSPLRMALVDPQNQLALVTLIMTVPGIPCIGKGDEEGLTSDLVRFRRMNSALLFGQYATLDVGPFHIVFSRQHEDNVVIVGINLGRDAFAVTLDLSELYIGDEALFVNVLEPSQDTLAVKQGLLGILELGAHTATVLASKNA